MVPQGDDHPASYYEFVGGGNIGADLALSFECEDIPRNEPTINTVIDPADFEGFLVVLSRKPLDVVAVYEVEEEETEETEVLDVETVKEQKVQVPQNVWNNLGGEN